MIKNIVILFSLLFIFQACAKENTSNKVVQEDSTVSIETLEALESETMTLDNNNSSALDNPFKITKEEAVDSPSITIQRNIRGKDNIIVYNAFSNGDIVIISGRAQEKKEQEEVRKEESSFDTFLSQINFFNNDEIKNTHITAFVNNKNYQIKTDNEGYFNFEITLDSPLDRGYKTIELKLENNFYSHETNLTVITNTEDTKITGIISDIDDTILLSDVTSKTNLALNTFWKNYKQREVIPQMVQKLNDILAINPQDIPTPLFFVSGSPRQLAVPIESFLEYNHFPEHQTFLKEISFFNILDQKEYKTAQISAIIELYPQIEWILLGDSGESDKTIYQTLKDEFPEQIKGFYIRDVKTKEIKFFSEGTSILESIGDFLGNFE